MSKSFTSTEDETIRRLAALGYSFGMVAEEMGRTRNMIAGRARRIGVKFSVSPENWSEVCRQAAWSSWDRRRAKRLSDV